MNKIFLPILICFCSAFVSCEKTSPPEKMPLVLPSNIFSISSITDVGTENNGADIQAELNLLTSAQNLIAEARFFLIKSGITITESAIKQLGSNSYISDKNFILVDNQTRTIKPDKTFRDTDGDLIKPGVNYQGYVAVFGLENTFQLSKAFPFNLVNDFPFAGDYIGTWEDLGPPGPALFPMSLRINADNTGSMFYANDKFKPYGKGTEDARVVMTIDNGQLKSFVLNQSIEGYHNGCLASKSLTGTITKTATGVDLILNTFLWEDCDGKRDVKLKFKK